MAKVKLSGLIQSISGKCGDIVFVRRRDKVIIMPRVKTRKDANSKKQKEFRGNFAYIISKWKQMMLTDKVLWEDYAKRVKKNNSPTDGIHAFAKVNLSLLGAGFKIIENPPPNESNPPYPLSELRHLGRYTAPLKFNIWLPNEYKTRTTAIIWIEKKGTGQVKHRLNTPIPIGKEAKQVIIDKIKIRAKGKGVVETELKELIPCVLEIQMRTIAENGKVSIPSPLYKIDIR